MRMTETGQIDSYDNTLPYLLFSVGKYTCGINCEYVCGIETLGKYTNIINSEPDVRGGVFYQDNFIPLIDMRKILGFNSQVDEFEKSVNTSQRIKDHEDWFLMLEKSIREKTEFTLTDDPRICSFGKWFYSFKTDNNVLRHNLKAIEYPHQEMHNTAKVVRKLMQEKAYEQALLEAQKARDTHYKTTIRILSSLRDIVTNSLKELYIVVNSKNCMKGIIVDSIISIEDLNAIESDDSIFNFKHVEFLGKRKKDNGIVIVFNNSF